MVNGGRINDWLLFLIIVFLILGLCVDSDSKGIITDKLSQTMHTDFFEFIFTSFGDITPPTFVTIPANASINYLEALGVDFDATDETEFDDYAVNNSKFIINGTGWLSNSTHLGAGVYELNISINDSSGNLNWTLYKVTVNKIAPTAILYIDTAWTREYDGTDSYISTTEYNIGDSDVSYILWRDGEDVGPTDLIGAIGSYDYKINTTGGENYSATDNLDTNTLIIQDTTAPNYSDNQTNSSDAGASVLFSLLVDDFGGLNTSGQYIFSTNNSGSWENDSAVNFTITPEWANVTKILNDNVGSWICYKWYLTDNAGNENVTSDYCLNVTASEIAISISLSSALAQQINWSFNSLPVVDQAAYGNNGAGVTSYYVNISVEGGTADLYVKANGDLTTGGGDILGIGNETYSNSTVFSSVPSSIRNSLTTNYVDNLIGDNLVDGNVVYLKFYLNAPSGQAAGSYNNTLMFKAVPHGESP